jgi:N6-L-threonylcarbamoyladenine synthase
VERHASRGNPDAIPMPRMIERKTQMEFSYSGLKTHMAQLIAREPAPLQESRINDLCAAFQRAAFDQLVRKLELAVKQAPHVKSIIVAGGVSANSAFRTATAKAFRIPCHFPAMVYCSDNAAMIAALGWHRLQIEGAKAFLDHGWDVYPRYPFELYKVDSAGSHT